MGGSFAAMFGVNEIRMSLSHFERGRIAVLAAQRAVLDNTDAVLAALFKAARKDRRSKI